MLSLRNFSRLVTRRPNQASSLVHRSFTSKPQGEENSEAGDDQQNSSSKDIGNPITWANPTGGPSMDEKRPKQWRYVYPAGVAFIVFGFWLSGRRLKKQEAKEKAEKSMARKMSSMGFSAPPK